MDGRVLTEMLDPAGVPPAAGVISVATSGLVFQSSLASINGNGGNDTGVSSLSGVPGSSAYSDAEDAAIQQRLADLGYL